MNNDKEYLNNLRHSCAHLVAAAVIDLYPGAQNAIGPAIEDGFYQDFDLGDHVISEDDLPRIEEKMKKILESWDSMNEETVAPEKAKEVFHWNQYKREIVDDILARGEQVKLQTSGSFIDLCRGGHVKKPKEELKYFKLLSVAGAYWKGNEKNKMLTRIYGTAFEVKDELDKHLALLEEAKKRDHRKLGRDLDLFYFSDLVGRGLPLFTPKGTVLREELNAFSQGLRQKRGFQKVWIPHITKNDLYKTSGHWDKFGDELFLVKSQETNDELVMKPMNCPHHQQIYASRPRSYKDLPIKYLETTTIYRDEKAGELLGLSRVRSVTQDDSHIFSTPEQISDIFQMLIEISKEFYQALDMKFRVRLSYRDPHEPDKYLGDPKLWESAQEIIQKIAQQNKLEYYEAPGEAAFYGPKIDFMILDALGREWQIATAQLDFVQPSRFSLKYTDKDGVEKIPVMIHYALVGSLERFLAVYIEHTAGNFPLWLAPIQVAVLPVSDKINDVARKMFELFNEADIRVELDTEAKTLPAKIREWTLKKVPYMCIIGHKEAEKGDSISVRTRDGKDLGLQNIYEFIKQLKQDIGKKI
ncbi:threonine--tRNA ligase [Candidatus Roizmanbacteria bacterium RIFCSPHIGHO2_02_FULL_37_24]|uniref:Threonine--tRNA ligase n=1 Tax=Candidatus Roizmanbacteria bacterium RIFCSPHIGHO2_02_FULL_37_24 TaxID=1802037 RepID=A0A1F7GVJ8_9BACT|nr:MAG: threonine--tRNA ligase [Candidatus Roizmanbacteria bacterium RIFCSPHIGHO2_02_FULL_37_24]OGK44991.1 MAG: threonine--tRNA ligase [Candidatus Roizmanbacteria bacterium RIFCSPLOWO2_01_FULL_37_57]